MGLTMTVGFGVSLPFLFVADTIVEKIGRPVIFTMSFFMYGVRLIGYSFITNPWMCFPFELLEVITFQLTWVAAVTYCHIIAPKGLLATMTGLIGATHYSIGRGVGAFLGGVVINKFGTPRGFQIFGCIAIGSGFLYIILHNLFLKRKIEQVDTANIEKPWKEVGSLLLSTDTVINGDTSVKQEQIKLYHIIDTIDNEHTSERKNSVNRDKNDVNDDTLTENQSMLLRGRNEDKDIHIDQQNGRIRNRSDSDNRA